MNYKELKDRLSKCEYTLKCYRENKAVEKDNKTVKKLELLKESLENQLKEQEAGMVVTKDSEEAEKLAKKGVNVQLTKEGPHQTTYIKVSRKDYKKAIQVIDQNIDSEYVSTDIVDDDGDGNVIVYFNFTSATTDHDHYNPDSDPAEFIYDLSMDLEANGISVVDKSHDLDETKDINDPVLMKLRALKTKIGRKKGIVKGGERHSGKKTAILSKLQTKRDQVMRDMEQEAEPEGGPIADKYGDMLNKIDAAIAKAKGTKPKSYDDTFNEGQDDVFALGYDLDATQYLIDYLKYKYKEGQDYELHIGRGDTHPNAITLINPKMEQDKELGNLLMNAGDQEETDYQADREAEKDYIGEKKRPGLWANIRAKRARGEKPAHKNSNAHKDAVKAGQKINKEGLWANINAKRKAGKKASHGNSKAHKDAVKAGNKLKEQDNVNLSKEHLSIIASKAGKAIVQAVHASGDEVSKARIKKVFSSALSPSVPEAFTVHIIYKNDSEVSYRFQIDGNKLIFLANDKDIVLSDVGVKPSGEPFINTELVKNEMTKYFKQMQEINEQDIEQKFDDRGKPTHLGHRLSDKDKATLAKIADMIKNANNDDYDYNEGIEDVIDPADYGVMAQNYLDGFDRPHSLDADELEMLGRKIVKQLYKGDFKAAMARHGGTNVNEEYTKQKLLAYLGQSDDAMIRTFDDKYLIIYNPKNGNDDNANMWNDDTVFGVDQDGEEHEVRYDQIDGLQLEDIKENSEMDKIIQGRKFIKDLAPSMNKLPQDDPKRIKFIKKVKQINAKYKELLAKQDDKIAGTGRDQELDEGRGDFDDVLKAVQNMSNNDDISERDAAAEIVLALADKFQLPVDKNLEDYMQEVVSEVKVGDTLTKDGKKGKVTKISDTQATVDFGNGDVYGIAHSRIKGSKIVKEEDTIKESSRELETLFGAIGYSGGFEEFIEDNPGAVEALHGWITSVPEFRKRLSAEFSNSELDGMGIYDIPGYDDDDIDEAEARPIPDTILRGYNANVKNAQSMATALLSLFNQINDKEPTDFTANGNIKRVLKLLNYVAKAPDTEADQEVKESGPGFAHDCAAKVVHEKYGKGNCIPEKHTLVKEGEKHVVTHYDVLFESGKTVEDIPVSELEIKTSNEHWHKGYKKKKK